nr:6724_t:CDS:2 [Entrophospora candida]
MKNDLLPEELNERALDLASSAPNNVTGSSCHVLLRKAGTASYDLQGLYYTEYFPTCGGSKTPN